MWHHRSTRARGASASRPGRARPARAAPVALAAAVLWMLALGATPAAAAAATCARTLSVAIPTYDIVAFDAGPEASVRVRGDRTVRDVRVAVRRGSRIVASGRHAGRLRAGRTTLDLRRRAPQRTGELRATATAVVRGCGRVRVSASRRMIRSSAPVRTASSRVEADGDVATVRLRAIGRGAARDVRVQLRDARDRPISVAEEVGRLRGSATVRLTLTGLRPRGAVRAILSGRVSGDRVRNARSTVVLRDAPADAGPGDSGGESPRPSSLAHQRATVSWSGGRAAGASDAGFVVPGIGYGEVVCSPDTQWIRVYPADRRREVSMMTWTYKDWGSTPEKALREALQADGTGPDFNEGLNKFTPAEKRATGEFVGLISDRGVVTTAEAEALADPVRFRLRWSWDFSRLGDQRCQVTIDVESTVPDPDRPPTRGAQVLWFGDAAGAAHDLASEPVAGLGVLTLVCRPGERGLRQVTLDTPSGGTITTRQGSVDRQVRQARGPLTTRLPGNGQVQIDVDGGGSVLIASRAKVNDDRPDRNWCAVAAHATGRR